MFAGSTQKPRELDRFFKCVVKDIYLYPLAKNFRIILPRILPVAGSGRKKRSFTGNWIE